MNTPYLPSGGSTEALVTLIDADHAAGVAPILWGDAGVGKTAIIDELAKRPGCAGAYKLALNSMERPDMLGMPRIVAAPDGRQVTDFADPRWITELNRTPDGQYAYLIIDELTTAAPDMQNTLLGPIQSREVASGTRLNDNVRIVLAANPPDLIDSVYELNAPLANRLHHIDFHIDVAEWLDGFLVAWNRQLGPVEQRVRSAVYAFLHQHNDVIHAEPGDPRHDRSRAWPSRRSWDKGAAALAQLPPVPHLGALSPRDGADRSNTALLRRSLSGFVGADAAAAFTEFLVAFRLPAPEAIAADPGTGVDWSDWVTAHTALASVISWVTDLKSADQAVRVLEHAASATELRDTATLMVTPFIERCRDLGVSPRLPDIAAFGEFVSLVHS